MNKPYGWHENVTHWEKTHDLEYVPKSRNCFHWVLKEKCNQNCYRSHAWQDHGSTWIDSVGKRYLLFQPYNVDWGCFDSLRELSQHPNLKVWINGLGWYGHGTVAVWITRKD